MIFEIFLMEVIKSIGLKGYFMYDIQREKYILFNLSFYLIERVTVCLIIHHLGLIFGFVIKGRP